MLRSLTNRDQDIIRQFLLQDPLSNLYLIDLLDRQGVDFWGFCRWTAVFAGDSILALNVDVSCLQPNHPCKLSVPLGDPKSCELLGEYTASQGGTERVSSEREASDGFYLGLGEPEYRIFQDQRLFYAEQSLPGDFLPLKPAVEEEFDILLEYTALMRKEDEDFDPRERDEELWRKTVATLIAQKRILVHHIEEAISFVIEVGTRCPAGSQIGSAYVPPTFRRQGLGFRGMRGTVEYLIDRCQFVCLLAHEQNIPAIACHNRAGFTKGEAFRLIEMNLW